MKRILSLFIVFATGFLIAGCVVVDPSDDVNPWETMERMLDERIPAAIDQSLILPEEDLLMNASISWSSSHPEILDSKGRYFAINEPIDITLNALVTIADETKTFSYSIRAGKATSDNFDVLWDYVRGRLSPLTNRNLSFRYSHPTIESLIRYESSDETIMTNEGVVFRSMHNQNVQLTIEISHAGNSQYYAYDVLVGKLTDGEIRDLIYDWLEDQIDSLFNGEVRHLPNTHPTYGGTIKWSSNVTGVVTLDGRITKPILSQDITFHALIKSGNTVRMRSIQTSIDGYTENNIDEFRLEWLEHQMPRETWGVLNLFHPGAPAIISDIVPDRSKMTSGIKRPLTQAQLDANMFPGYKMTNPDQVLWIVIHESGMPQAGNDAIKLNQIMLNKQISNPASSSWHYTVDAYRIFHHIPDNEIAWHAGGGTGLFTHGNSNGIGIEMCINEDGDYEGALRNYAKLVAHLLIKHNLTINNIKQHYDFSQKNCPAYLRNDQRWFDFIDMVQKEYILQRYFSNAVFTWTVDRMDILVKLNEGVYKIIPQSEDVVLQTTLNVQMGELAVEYQFETLIRKSD